MSTIVLDFRFLVNVISIDRNVANCKSECNWDCKIYRDFYLSTPFVKLVYVASEPEEL